MVAYFIGVLNFRPGGVGLIYFAMLQSGLLPWRIPAFFIYPKGIDSLEKAQDSLEDEAMGRRLPNLLIKWQLFLILGCVALVWAAGCTSITEPANGRTQLTVFAAASLTDAFTELGQAFEAEHESVTVLLNFAGSSQLAAQLQESATADVFASANEAVMETAVSNNLVQSASVHSFALNRLTLVVPADNPAMIMQLTDLAKPGVQIISAVPGVPVRTYSDLVVEQMDAAFQEQFYANLVSEEDNVRQVVAKLVLGEADAGFAYASDITPAVATNVTQIPLPEAQNVVAAYPIGVVASAPYPELAHQFIAFILSQPGQMILANWGFAPPTAE